MRRAGVLALVVAAAGIALAAPARAQSIRVTLLGTGTPIPRADRLGPSTLVEAGSQKLLFDAGRGVPIRLAQLHVPMGQLTAVFLTHQSRALRQRHRRSGARSLGGQSVGRGNLGGAAASFGAPHIAGSCRAHLRPREAPARRLLARRPVLVRSRARAAYDR